MRQWFSGYNLALPRLGPEFDSRLAHGFLELVINLEQLNLKTDAHKVRIMPQLSEIQTNIIVAIVSIVLTGVIAYILNFYNNKRWLFSKTIDMRTEHILKAYQVFIITYSRLNHVATNPKQNIPVTKEDRDMPHNLMTSLYDIQLWINTNNIKKLSRIIGAFSEYINIKEPTETKQKEMMREIFKLQKIIADELNIQQLNEFIRKTANNKKMSFPLTSDT